MTFCDVCARPADDTEVVANAEFKGAVRTGFDPFALGLPGEALRQVTAMAEIQGLEPYPMWRDQIVAREHTDWAVCPECMAPLRAYLRRSGSSSAAASPVTARCSECDAANPASQWHCSTCGNIQWGLIAFSAVLGTALAIWVIVLGSIWSRVLAGLGGLLFLYIAVTSAREGLANRRRIRERGGPSPFGARGGS
jgi:hypothetical protein